MTGPLVYGDAPYFFPENLETLFNKPLLWDFRNNNFGASESQVLWLYLPTFLMGLLGKLGVSAEIAVRIIFYFPATILAFLGSLLFIKSFVKNNFAATLGSFLYVFNTYFLLLIDGGQIGLALSYGLFPLFLYFINKGNFLLSFLTFFFLTNTDLRVAILAILTYFLINFNRLSKKIIYIVFLTIMLDAFWLVPFIFTGLQGVEMGHLKNELPANFITIFNGLTIYNPHFPLNEFGKANAIPWYFIFLPLLLFTNVLFKNRRENLILYILFFMFISLIIIPFGPLKPFFDFIMNHIPLASAFRDSTKFFIPLILIASILLAKTLEGIKSNLFSFVVYLYLLLLILPALTGNLSGVLAGRKFDENYNNIYQNLKSDNNFYRTIWFPERPPLGFSTQGREGISASELYKELPFAMMITGTYDQFNFLHDPKLSSWFEVLGIKYAFFPEPPRQKIQSETDIKNRKLFLEFINTLGLKKLDWGINFPVFEIAKQRDKIYGAKKILVVVGNSSLYDKLDFTKVPILFVEDGFTDPSDLLALPKTSFNLVFHNSDEEDLKMSFLQKFFLKDGNLSYNNWGRYKPSELLQWRYELLKKGIANFDFGFNKGIYFSSIKDEEINFKVKVLSDDKYYLATRFLSATDSAGIKIKFSEKEEIIKNESSRFKWNFLGPVTLSKGDYIVNFKNLKGFVAINTLALISEKNLIESQTKTDTLLRHSNKETLDDANNIIKVDYKQDNQVSYRISNVSIPSWIIFSDHFNSGWELESSNGSYPVYSMINGFYIKESSPSLKLEYKPQKYIDRGIILSISSFLILTGIWIFKFYKK